jgi:hypothetical protein
MPYRCCAIAVTTERKHRKDIDLWHPIVGSNKDETLTQKRSHADGCLKSMVFDLGSGPDIIFCAVQSTPPKQK